MTDVIKTHASTLPAARNIRWNPSPAELRELTSRMPNARHTEYDNYNVQTKVVSRSKASTYVVTDRPEEHSDQTISRADGAKIAERQDAYIRDQDMLVIDGYIGNDAEHRVARAALHRGRQCQHRRHAAVAVLRRRESGPGLRRRS